MQSLLTLSVADIKSRDREPKPEPPVPKHFPRPGAETGAAGTIYWKPEPKPEQNASSEPEPSKIPRTLILAKTLLSSSHC